MINKSRLEALSDAIIAILMTIMALEIKIPTGINLADFKHSALYIAAYFVSFIISMAFWFNYHRLFMKIDYITKRGFWINVLWLIMMSLFPMATGWLSEHPMAKIPAYFYYLVYLLWCISYYLLEYVLLRHSH